MNECVLVLYTAHITYHLMAVYNSAECNRTSACEDASGYCYQTLECLYPLSMSKVITLVLVLNADCMALN